MTTFILFNSIANQFLEEVWKKRKPYGKRLPVFFEALFISMLTTNDCKFKMIVSLKCMYIEYLAIVLVKALETFVKQCHCCVMKA